MKIIAKPINVVACFIHGDPPMPYKFKVEEDHTVLEIRVEKILKIEQSMLAGIDAIIYTCQSIIRGTERRYDLKYIKKDCSWELYQM